jgi:hypothetical protein
MRPRESERRGSRASRADCGFRRRLFAGASRAGSLTLTEAREPPRLDTVTNFGADGWPHRIESPSAAGRPREGT